MTADVVCRRMTEDDIDAGLRLCRAAKWNQLRRDWELFLRLSPGGCRVAMRDGRTIGTVATVRYEDHFAWVSMVLVDPDERGRGVGTLLLQQALEILSDMQSVRLDATPAGRPVYRRLDFQDEYRLARLEASALRLDSGDTVARPLTLADIPAISELDKQYFGADRRMLLEWLLTGTPEYAWMTDHGYVLGRHGHTFEHIGPMIAADVETAQALFRACVPPLANRPVILDVPEHSPLWRVWLESIGFTEQRPFTRMYRGNLAHPGEPEMQYAITGPEFG
jgi:GNAT superfamily N-acetyltransferase